MLEKLNYQCLESHPMLRQLLDLKLEKIHFKIDPKKFSLFLETKNPKINYHNLIIPIENVKLYLNFVSLLKSKITPIKGFIFFTRTIDTQQIGILRL